jgi:hypothetical protein
MLSIAEGGCFGRELWCTIVTVCGRQDVVNDTVVGNVGVDPELSTRDLVQGVSEVSGVGQLGSIWVQVGAFARSISMDVGGEDGKSVSSISRAQCVGQRKDWKLDWCTAMKVYNTGQDPKRARNKN